MGDSVCSAGDIHMDTRGQWVTVAAVLAIPIWIHVVSRVTVAAVLPIHIWIHVTSGCKWLQCCDRHMDTRDQWDESGCSAADTHMVTRGQWVIVAAVLAIHIWIHVASG